MSSDRNLLFGILAVQMDFISRDTLIAAMHAWVLDKHRSLSDILQSQGKLSVDRAKLLNALVAEHLKTHDNDPQKSLAALSSVQAVRFVLKNVADADVQQSLRHLPEPVEIDPYKTTSLRTASTAEQSLRFRILRPHAKGGLGEVFVAEDTELHREVALKEIQEHYADDDNSRGRFVLEAEVTGGLEHPNIVPVYGLGTYADGRPFYAMRFIRGDSLKEAIDRYYGENGTSPTNVGGSANLAFRNMLKRFVDVCNAMAYAHSRGILHRDLKPGNIMLGKYGETLVVDWGMAKPLTGPQRESGETLDQQERALQPTSGSSYVATQTGIAVGTPAFMSPEQAEGRLDELSPASDVYSLGATLYVILTGKIPFQGGVGDVLRKVIAGEFASPLAVHKQVPAALNAVVLQAMSRRKQDRYATATALAEEIEHYLADEPVLAYREQFAVRTNRWMRKHPRLMTAIAATVLVGTVGLTAGLYFVNAEKNRTNQARKDADDQRDAAILEKNRADNEATAARLAEGRANQRLDQIAKSNEILESIFASLDPKEIAKAERPLQAILVEKLDRAVAQLEGNAIGDPEVVAKMQFTLGGSLVGLGEPRKAIVLFEKSRDAYRSIHGLEHAVTLSVMQNLAEAYKANGEYKKALDLALQTLDLRKKLLGPNDPDTLRSIINVATAYSFMGMHDVAIPLEVEALKLMQEKIGPEEHETLVLMNNLAESYEAIGKYELSLPLKKENLALMKKKLGPNDPDTLAAMGNLAAAYHSAGKRSEALQLYQETLELKKDKLGPEHVSTLMSMADLGVIHGSNGNDPLALKLLEEALKILKAKLGADHPYTLATMKNLANHLPPEKQADVIAILKEIVQRYQAKLGHDHPVTLRSMGSLASNYYKARRFDLAIPLYKETMRLMGEKLTPDHPDTLITIANLGGCMVETGNLREGLPMLEKAFSLMSTKLGAKHRDTLATMSRLAHGHGAAQRLDLSIPMLEELLPLQKEELGPDHPATLRTMSNLAVNYLSAARAKEAIVLLEDCVARIDRLPARQTVALKSVRGELIAAYGMDNQHAKAEPMHREAVDKAKKDFGVEDARTAEQQIFFGLNLMAQKKWTEAETVVREALATRQKIAADDFRTFNTQSMLGEILMGQNKFSDAEPLLLAGYQGMKDREAKMPVRARRDRLRESLLRLIQVAEAQKKPDEVKKWQTELEAVEKKYPAPIIPKKK